MRNKIAIYTTDQTLSQQAKHLANELHLPLIHTIDSQFPFLLHVDQNGLSLIQTQKNSPGPIRVDFTQGKINYRRKSPSRELLAKAVGIKPHQPLSVIDATAGLGTDAFLLASLGAEVTLIERSDIIFALLEDGITRGRLNPDTQPILQRIHLIKANSIDYLANLSNQLDVIYLDPMFPTRTKTALVKKEMQTLQTLIGSDDDIEQLFNISLEKAKKRVVVKRPRLAPSLCNKKPNFQYIGRSTRFDVYLGLNID